MRTTLTKEEKENFEQQIDKIIASGGFPNVVYKFRCWNDQPNDHIIRHKTIYLSSPSELLADYPEAILPIDESQITEENLMKLAQYHTSIFFPELPPRLAQLKAQELRKSMLIEDPKHRIEAEGFAMKRNDEVLGIFCSSITFDNIEMWEAMACLSTGYAVGIRLKELLLDDRVSGSASIVKYYPMGDPPKVSPFSFSEKERIEKALEEINNVPKTYDYEKEIRIVRTNRKILNGIVQPYEAEDRLVKLNDEQIEEILLGPNISEKDKNEILEITNVNFPTIPVYLCEFINGRVVKAVKLR